MQSYGVFLCYPKKLRNFAQLSFISNNYTVTDKMKIALMPSVAATVSFAR